VHSAEGRRSPMRRTDDDLEWDDFAVGDFESGEDDEV
jgi:hypothetical protein